MTIEQIILKQPISVIGDAEAQKVMEYAANQIVYHKGIYWPLCLCIAYGEIRGKRQERSKKRRI